MNFHPSTAKIARNTSSENCMEQIYYLGQRKTTEMENIAVRKEMKQQRLSAANNP